MGPRQNLHRDVDDNLKTLTDLTKCLFIPLVNKY